MKNFYTPLELLNLYYSDGQCTGSTETTLWQRMNSLLSWDNLLFRGYQSDLCPLFYFIITKALPTLNGGILGQSSLFEGIVPDTIRSHLQKHYCSSLRRNMILLNALRCVAEELEKDGIQVVILKGGHLADSVYENIACRPMVDLDILIRQRDREECYAKLMSMGYISIAENRRKRLLHHSFFKTCLDVPVIIEVHHQLVKEVFLTSFDLNEIFTLGYVSLEYQIVYLSWHAIHHGLTRFLWLCDLAQLMKNQADFIEWQLVRDKASRFGISGQWTLAKQLVCKLLIPSVLTNKESLKDHLTAHIAELLFVKIQNNVKKAKNEKINRHLLNILMMNRKNIKIFLPKYIRYRFG